MPTTSADPRPWPTESLVCERAGIRLRTICLSTPLTVDCGQGDKCGSGFGDDPASPGLDDSEVGRPVGPYDEVPAVVRAEVRKQRAIRRLDPEPQPVRSGRE